MATDAPLSDLCSICYTGTRKYRCPRCKARTCSLDCYKTHQKRASCNGKRDTAAYLKKSELLTPASFDHDYNYLKGLEDGIELAHKESAERGTDGAGKRVVKHNFNEPSKIQQYFNSNKITIERAPAGMSRQKTNDTRRTKRGNVMWTIEWIDPNGGSDIQQHCPADESIQKVRGLLDAEKRNQEIKKHKAAKHTAYLDDKKRKKELLLAGKTEEPKPVEEAKPEDPPEPDLENIVFGDGDAYNNKWYTLDPDVDIASDPRYVKPNRYFYLLKVGTSSPHKVLVPLNERQTLTKSLQGQVLLEYPTIYIFKQAPDELPPGFILEKEYLEARKAEEKELKDAMRKAGPPPAKKARTESASVDPNKILDMLKRDVTR